MEIFLELAAVLLLISINGFFALSEMALVAAKKVRLEARVNEGDLGAGTALLLKEKPDVFFSSVQIGITLVGILTGAIGGATLAAELSEYLTTFEFLAPYSKTLGLILVVIPITYVTLVLGELVPKQLAITRPEKMAGMTALPMRMLMSITWPVVHFLSFSTRTFLRLVGFAQVKEPGITEEEIRAMVREAAFHGVVEHAEKDMINRVFRLNDLRVGPLMTHRSRIVWLNTLDPSEENIMKIMSSPFSRFPVAEGDLTKTLGVIKAKEYLGHVLQSPQTTLKDNLQEPLYIPETMPALDLLKLFKNTPGMHFALVIDQWHDIQGLVTLNDIMEAVVGEIPQSDSELEPSIVKRKDGSLLLDGLLPFEVLRDILHISEPLDEGERTYQTLAGLILKLTGHIPEIGERLEWKGYTFEIVDMDGRRIDRVLVSPKEEEGGH